MTIDKLIEELEHLKSVGIKGETKVYVYAELEGSNTYVSPDTLRIDGEGDLIIE